MFNIYIFIFLLIIIIIFISIAYIRIKFGFWAIQPVFHIYDIGYMIWPPGIINHELPSINKYTNLNNIKIYNVNLLSEIKINKTINFIKINYLQNKENVFTPEFNNIIPYFKGHNYPPLITFYNTDIVVQNLKKGTIINDEKIIGIMTTRPIMVTIKSDNNNNMKQTFDAYYVDYLCVDKMSRKKGIAPQIIQTHHYYQSHMFKNISVSLFKREEELTGIVPLCFYYTYGFSANKWHKPLELHSKYKMIEINPQNIYKLLDFIKDNNHRFDIIINTSESNIIELIKTNNIFIVCLMEDDEILCCYFYRKTCTFITKNIEILSCFASINNTDNNIFIQGFKISFWNTAAKYNFGYSAIENISHNNLIIDNVIKKTKPDIISPTAYFFYNFAYYTFKPNKVLIIN
jgi:hypothetical protein